MSAGPWARMCPNCAGRGVSYTPAGSMFRCPLCARRGPVYLPGPHVGVAVFVGEPQRPPSIGARLAVASAQGAWWLLPVLGVLVGAGLRVLGWSVLLVLRVARLATTVWAPRAVRWLGGVGGDLGGPILLGAVLVMILSVLMIIL